MIILALILVLISAWFWIRRMERSFQSDSERQARVRTVRRYYDDHGEADL